MSAVRALRPLPEAPPPRIVPIPWALALETERSEATTRTRGSMAASVVVHALLAVLLVSPRAQQTAETFTEITLVEPAQPEPGAAAAARAAPALQTASGGYAASARDQRFERSAVPADVSPVPQSEATFEDRLRARLATLQQSASSPTPGVAEAEISGVLSGASARPTSLSEGGFGQRTDLKRGAGGDAGPAVALTRGPGLASSSLTPATLGAERTAAPAAAREEGATLRRTLAGALLVGPVADRPVLSRRTPDYPDWAMRDGVEGSVTLHFIVRADGTVKENILVERTAGFEDFDESARRALRDWRFQPLAGGRTGEQWGNITFHFRIRETG